VALTLIFSFNNGDVFNSYYSPSIAAICVYYWVFNYPKLISVFDIFFVSLISDFVNQTPIGTETFALIFTYILTISQKELVVRYGFTFFWCYLAYFLLIYCTIKFLILSLYFWEFNISQNLMAQLTITFLLYPLLHKLLSYISLKREVSLKI
jgi:hypothetical protein